MKTRFTALGAALVLGACSTAPVPEINSDKMGVGFGTPEQFVAMQRAQRDAELMAMREASTAPPPVTEEQSIAAETMTALNVDAGSSAPTTAASTSAPMTALAVEATPLSDNPNISDEQNFDAVASRETINSDAQRLERNREQYQQVMPVALPERDGRGGPNIVSYALTTNHPVGTQLHRRSGRTTPERFSRVCQSYGSDDQAQQAFLANGGPERDRKGVDPDGDGYACDWSPMPFRLARGG